MFEHKMIFKNLNKLQKINYYQKPISLLSIMVKNQNNFDTTKLLYQK